MPGYAAGSAVAPVGAAVINHASPTMAQARRVAGGGSAPSDGMRRGSAMAVEAPATGRAQPA